MTDAAIHQHEQMPEGLKFLVGLYQETRLSSDPAGGEDGMWFVAAVEAVATRTDDAVNYVAAHWPHDRNAISPALIRQRCNIQ